MMSVESLLERCCIEVGLVASGASAISAPVQFYRKAEDLAVDEQVALIQDPRRRDELALGVLRGVTRLEPLVRDRVRTPFVDRPEVLDQTILMPFTVGHVKIYAMLNMANGSISEVRQAPVPGSRVFIVRDGTFLNSFIKVKHD